MQFQDSDPALDGDGAPATVVDEELAAMGVAAKQKNKSSSQQQ